MTEPFTLSHLENNDYPWGKVAKLPVCPRCKGYIPNNDNPGAYPGAISRIDNETEICSPCGQNEAINDYLKGHPNGD